MNRNISTKTGLENIAAELKEVQKGCRARLISVEDVQNILVDVEETIGIPNCDLTGTVVHYTGAEKFPGAYKGIPDSTQFSAKYNGKSWDVYGIGRYTCPNREGNVDILLSDGAKEAVIEKASRYRVII